MTEFERYLPYIDGAIPSCNGKAWTRLEQVGKEGSKVKIKCNDVGAFSECGGCIYRHGIVPVDLQQLRSKSLDPHEKDTRPEQDGLYAADEF